MKIKTSDLIGAQLDWAVELAKGTHWSGNGYFIFKNPERYDKNPEWKYSTDWAQAGPIIEWESISVVQDYDDKDGYWEAAVLVSAQSEFGFNGDFHYRGETPLSAAMRCYVASRLGDEIEIPDELT